MTATAPHFGPTPSVSPMRRPLAAAALLAAVRRHGVRPAAGRRGPASAHAALTGSDPQDGAVVATAPKEVTLTFSEQVAMSDDSVRVLDPSGKRVDTGKIRDLSSGGTVTYGVTLHSGLPDGTFTVAWQAVSADSHPVSGAFTFSIGAPSQDHRRPVRPDRPAAESSARSTASRATLSYAGFILLVGGAAFVLACWQRGAGVRPLQRLVVVAAGSTLTAATLAMLLLRGSVHRLREARRTSSTWTACKHVLQTKPGAALVSRLLLLAAAALFIAVLFGAYAKREDERGEEGPHLRARHRRRRRRRRASPRPGRWPSTPRPASRPASRCPSTCCTCWPSPSGSAASPRCSSRSTGRRPSNVTAVRRFSRIAFGSVLVLAATGLYQSWRQVGSWSALTGTSYGQLLLVKIGLVAVLVGIAWISRRWTARLSEAPPAKAVAAKAAAGRRGRRPRRRSSVATANGAGAAVAAGSGDSRAGRPTRPAAGRRGDRAREAHPRRRPGPLRTAPLGTRRGRRRRRPARRHDRADLHRARPHRGGSGRAPRRPQPRPRPRAPSP